MNTRKEFEAWLKPSFPLQRAEPRYGDGERPYLSAGTEHRWQGWQAATTASQAREAELREKLEAAEARIKASQEQEPEFVDFEVYGYASDCARNESWCKEKDWRKSEFLNIIGEDWEHNDTIRNVAFHHYKQPPIPPELAELQRENAELRKLLEGSKVPESLRKVSSERLGDVFEKVLADNLWELYESAQPKEPKQ